MTRPRPCTTFPRTYMHAIRELGFSHVAVYRRVPDAKKSSKEFEFQMKVPQMMVREPGTLGYLYVPPRTVVDSPAILLMTDDFYRWRGFLHVSEGDANPFPCSSKPPAGSLGSSV